MPERIIVYVIRERNEFGNIGGSTNRAKVDTECAIYNARYTAETSWIIVWFMWLMRGCRPRYYVYTEIREVPTAEEEAAYECDC